MASVFTGADIAAATQRVALALIENADRFNRLDAAGGDGDMGTTLATVSQSLLADASAHPEDVGESLMRIAKVIGRTSGSSLSAVAMTGLIALAKTWSAKSEVAWTEMAPALADALAAMQARSRAKFGDKTMLDGLARIAGNLEGVSTGEQVSRVAQRASAEALQTFRNSPAMIGRLRLAPSGGMGTDDPGMVALDVAVSAMAASRPGRETGGAK